MKIFKPENNAVYDNLYSKPTQLGVPVNYKNSMTVIFSACGVLYYGSYNFVDGYWSTIPGDDLQRIFKDMVVEYWFYPPYSKDLFDKYRDDVEQKKCSDNISRIHEYDENAESGEYLKNE